MRHILALVAVLCPALAAAHSYQIGTIAIGHLWTPPAADGAHAAPIYGPLLNRGGTPVRLIAATTPSAAAVRFRVLADGKERWLAAIALAPGQPLALAPWREHLWLSGLKAPLKPGGAIELTLEFDNAARLEVTVVLEQAAGH